MIACIQRMRELGRDPDVHLEALADWRYERTKRHFR